jgi:pimeloyl-ACP methyl ester carboxylesterase
LIDPATAELFRQSIPGSKIMLYTSLGHVPHEEDPVATLRGLLPFLGEGVPR